MTTLLISLVFKISRVASYLCTHMRLPYISAFTEVCMHTYTHRQVSMCAKGASEGLG